MSALYDARFIGTDAIESANVYLFARTFAAFGRAADVSWHVQDVALCAGYHDQTLVYRIFNPAE
jgi:hypothetical protein